MAILLDFSQKVREFETQSRCYINFGTNTRREV